MEICILHCNYMLLLPKNAVSRLCIAFFPRDGRNAGPVNEEYISSTAKSRPDALTMTDDDVHYFIKCTSMLKYNYCNLIYSR